MEPRLAIDYLNRIRPAGWLKGCLYGLLIYLVYQSAIRQLIINDWAKEDYSHCMLIPFVILYLLWEKRLYPAAGGGSLRYCSFLIHTMSAKAKYAAFFPTQRQTFPTWKV